MNDLYNLSVFFEEEWYTYQIENIDLGNSWYYDDIKNEFIEDFMDTYELDRNERKTFLEYI